MQDIKVSVCIPTYNQADYLELAVRSAFEQTFKPFEIIVYNDCSTDNTAKVLKRLSLEIPLLKVVNQPQNLGIAGNVNACLRAAMGDFVIRLDSDDNLLPNYTEKILGSFMKYPEAGYAHCAVQEIDQSGNLLNQRRLIRGTGYKSGKNALKDALKGYRVAANILMFKKEALITVDYLTGLPDFGEDYYLTSAISAKDFGNVYIDQILACYRIWVDAGNVRQKRKLAEINGIRRVFNDVLEPAYTKLNWSLALVKKSKKKFACEQADCLSWNIYTPPEKEEIIVELNELSSSLMVKFVIWLYKTNLGWIVRYYKTVKSLPKSIIKTTITNIRRRKVIAQV